MRIVSLLAVIAILYIVISRHASPPASKDLKESMAAADGALGTASPGPGSTPLASSVYKQALDRAHAVVKKMEDSRRLEPEP